MNYEELFVAKLVFVAFTCAVWLDWDGRRCNFPTVGLVQRPHEATNSLRLGLSGDSSKATSISSAMFAFSTSVGFFQHVHIVDF